jgi:hypothetical protein
MSDERFDLTYRGELLPGADPDAVRERLSAIFRLSAAGAERLFTGRPVVVKRAVDEATRARYAEVFNQAGAVLVVVPCAATDEASAHSGGHDPGRISMPSERSTPPAGVPLALATDDGFIEALPTVNIDAFDTGSLSLVNGDDWSLADCQPLPTAIAIPDIGHLSLEEQAPRPEPRDPDEPFIES